MAKEKLKVLLVEDNPTDALIVKKKLQKDSAFDYDVMHVVSGEDAIAALEKAGKHEAVEFWTPYSGAQNFTFKKEVCKLIE